MINKISSIQKKMRSIERKFERTPKSRPLLRIYLEKLYVKLGNRFDFKTKLAQM